MNFDQTFVIEDSIKNKKYDFIKYHKYNENEFDDLSYITIVMTTHDRKEQTLYTLNSFLQSEYKKIKVVIVDDSIEGYMTEEELKFPFEITYITIENDKKKWINPCVNYNIGFNEAKSEKIIIQNGEICHIGDVIKYVSENLNDNNYLVFDVVAIKSLKCNRQLYNLGYRYDNVSRNLHYIMSSCYQDKEKNHRFNFLCAITNRNITSMNGFDYSFAYGSWSDDEFIYRIRNIIKLEHLSIDNNIHKIFGCHQWYKSDSESDLYLNMDLVIYNKNLFEQKKIYFETHGQWP